MPILRNYNRSFFKTWSADMAYILGFLFADGNITQTKRSTHYIAWYTSDLELLESMRIVLGSDHKISARSAKSGLVYRLQVGSREWFDDVTKFQLTPNKTSRMRLPQIPKKYSGDFIRGFFDGDGNVWSGHIHKKRLTTHLSLQVAFTSCSHDFLADLWQLLKANGVKGGSLNQGKSKTYSRLSFSRADALTIYKIMYNSGHKLFLDRKKSVFDTFVKENG